MNAVGTDVWPAHEVTGRDRDGGFTVRYLAGPKRGLHIHFFSAAELGNLFGSGFTGNSAAPEVHRARSARPRPVVPVGGHLAQDQVTALTLPFLG